MGASHSKLSKLTSRLSRSKAKIPVTEPSDTHVVESADDSDSGESDHYVGRPVTHRPQAPRHRSDSEDTDDSKGTDDSNDGRPVMRPTPATLYSAVPSSSTSTNDFTVAVATFTHRLISHMKTTCPIISVFSLHALLYHLSRGMCGLNQRALRRIIGLTAVDSGNDLASYYALYRRLTSSGNVMIYNFIAVSKDIKVSREFVRNSRRAIDIFDGLSGDGITAHVNRLIETNTGNRIKNFLDSTSKDDKIILGSAIHFSLHFVNSFNTANTHPQQFYHNGKSSLIPMMHATFKDICCYRDEDAGYQYIELQYDHCNMRIGFLLPYDGLTSDDVTAYDNRYFTSENITNAVQHIGMPETIYVSIPKFTIKEKMSLKAVISNMGGDFLFENIDMSNMIDTTDERQRDIAQKCYVTQIQQEVNFEINETSTEFTSAVTCQVRARGGVLISGFCANHRFYYHIYETTTQVPIVSGIFDHVGDD